MSPRRTWVRLTVDGVDVTLRPIAPRSGDTGARYEVLRKMPGETPVLLGEVYKANRIADRRRRSQNGRSLLPARATVSTWRVEGSPFRGWDDTRYAAVEGLVRGKT